MESREVGVYSPERVLRILCNACGALGVIPGGVVRTDTTGCSDPWWVGSVNILRIKCP